MIAYNNLLLEGDFKIRISSKKLKSGKYQVKFYATLSNEKELYGYLLVPAQETLKKVTQRINERLQVIDVNEGFFLYDMTMTREVEPNLIVFSNV